LERSRERKRKSERERERDKPLAEDVLEGEADGARAELRERATKRTEHGRDAKRDKPCLHQAAISPVTIKIIGYLDWKTTGRAGCLRIVVCIH